MHTPYSLNRSHSNILELKQALIYPNNKVNWQFFIFHDRYKKLFYHDVGEISDLSQSEAPNLVMWRVVVMQPRPRLLGDEVVVGPNLMFRKMDPWNVIRNILQDKTDKNQL